MADNQTTPGPWCVAYLDKNGQRVVKGEHIEIATCWHHSVGAIEKQMEANAHLIAAAPDMLAVLKRLDRIGGLGYDAHDRITAAIAKAEGTNDVR